MFGWTPYQLKKTIRNQVKKERLGKEIPRRTTPTKVVRVMRTTAPTRAKMKRTRTMSNLMQRHQVRRTLIKKRQLTKRVAMNTACSSKRRLT